MIVGKATAFLKRDFVIDTSYKAAFVLELAGSIFPLVIFFFVGKLVQRGGSPSLAKYGGSYFSFVAVGLAVSTYFRVALSTFASTVRRSQMAGCLEAMLNTYTRPETAIMLSALYGFLSKGVHAVLMLVAAALFFGVSFANANILSAVTVFVLTMACFSGLGIFSAALIVVLKKGDPIEWVFGALSSLLGGAYFPVTVMPESMQRLARVLPITYSLEGMRLALLRGYSVVMLWREILILGAMAAVLLPLSVLAFSRAVGAVRRDGSLMKY